MIMSESGSGQRSMMSKVDEEKSDFKKINSVAITMSDECHKYLIHQYLIYLRKILKIKYSFNTLRIKSCIHPASVNLFRFEFSRFKILS